MILIVMPLIAEELNLHNTNSERELKKMTAKKEVTIEYSFWF